MQRSVLHTVVALLAAAVLMLQHAPIVPPDHGSHEHCIHCTEHYCTKGGCDCGHKHRANPHQGHTPTQSSAHASVHTDAHDHGPAHGASQTDANGSHSSTIGTSIEPCGTPPSGIITFNLDKFVGGSSALAAQLAFERPSSAVYVGLTDQLVINQIFRPPVSG